MLRTQFGDPDLRDPTIQLRLVMAADFTPKPVMNRSEYEVFLMVEAEARRGGGFRVFSQTALGEVLRSQDEWAHRAINSKRVDVLVIGPNGLPVLVIEYQGKGHYVGGDAAARDAVKREALRKAGVEFIEVMDFHREDGIRHSVRGALDRALVRRGGKPIAAPLSKPAPPASRTIVPPQPSSGENRVAD